MRLWARYLWLVPGATCILQSLPQYMRVENTFDDMGDVHYYRKRYELAIRLLKNSSISQRNKELIEKFCNDCFAQGIKAGRVQKYAYILRKVAEWLGKDFDTANEDDLKRVVAMINTSPFTEWTKHDYKRSIKKFFKWLGKEELVSWIKCTRPKNRKLPEEILTEDDIKKMIDAAQNARDRAIVAVLYESGCRAGEFLSMKMKNVSFDRYGAIIIVHGKNRLQENKTRYLNSLSCRMDKHASISR